MNRRSARVASRRLFDEEADADDANEPEEVIAEATKSDDEFIDDDVIAEDELAAAKEADAAKRVHIATCSRARAKKKKDITKRLENLKLARESRSSSKSPSKEGQDGDVVVVEALAQATEASKKDNEKKKKLRNQDKIGLQEHYPMLTYWSVTHGNTSRDIDKESTLKYFNEFLDEKCELGLAFTERGKKMLKLHLQGWIALYCPITDSGKRAIKLLWNEWFGVESNDGWSIEIAPFQKRQNARYMSGYAAKSNDLDKSKINIDYVAKGEAFLQISDLKSYKRDYFVHCPSKENTHAAQITKSNLIAYAVNNYNRHYRALRPKPSLGRMLTWMMQSNDYEPATSFLSTGYPIDRRRAELMFDLLTSDRKSIKKKDVVDFIFSNNESMHQPLIDITPHKRPHYGPFGPDGAHPFGRGNMDWEGSEYDQLDFEEANRLAVQLNGEVLDKEAPISRLVTLEETNQSAPAEE